MSKAELRSYVLADRNDEEAFYAYMDKLAAEPGRIKHPPFKSLDDLGNYPEFLERLNNFRQSE